MAPPRRRQLRSGYVAVSMVWLTWLAAPMLTRQAALFEEATTRYLDSDAADGQQGVRQAHIDISQTYFDDRNVAEVAAKRRRRALLSESIAWQPETYELGLLQASEQPQETFKAEQGARTPKLRVDPKWNASPISRIPLQPGYTCEPPYSSNVRVHVLITLLTRRTYLQLRYLGMIGLTNADVFAYHRHDTGIQTPAAVELPCGMRFHEKLLVPNIGEEGTTFVAHVARYYDDLPDIIIALHGGSLQSWHSSCGVAIRRMRAAYRGLAPTASPAMRAFAADVVTLNSLTHDGPWIADDCCGPLFAKFSFQGNNPECPWAYVGDAATLWEGQHKQVLCRLRDEASGEQWTVLSTDVPEFFIHPNETLQKYRDNPALLARVDNHSIGPRRKLRHAAAAPAESPSPRPPESFARSSRGGLSAAPAGARRRLLDAEIADHTPAPPPAGAPPAPDSAGTGGTAPPGGPEGPKIERVRDSVFPQHREQDLVTPPRVFDNHPVYGLERFWNWILQVHGLYGNYTRDGQPGESAAKWCCFQGIVPKDVIQSVPKAWWLDAAFLVTHLAWKPQKEWPKQIGFLLEWRIWPSLDRWYITRERMQAYLDVEMELGPDSVLSRCAEELAVPLEAEDPDTSAAT